MTTGSGTSTTVTETGPPEFQIPFLKNVFSEAQRLYQEGPPQQVPGSSVARFAPLQLAAQQSLADFYGLGSVGGVDFTPAVATNDPTAAPPALPPTPGEVLPPDTTFPTDPRGDPGSADDLRRLSGQGSALTSPTPAGVTYTGAPGTFDPNAPGQQFLQEATTARQFGLGGVLSPDSNQYLADYARAATNPIFDRLTEDILPGLRSEAVASGNLGSTRQGIAEGLATSRATRDAADISAGIYSNAYSRGLDTFDRTFASLPEQLQLQLSPTLAAGAIGEQQQNFAQALLDEDAERFEAEQALPYQSLEQFLAFIGGGFGGSGSGSFTQPQGLLSWLF